mgnify:CR=1 FL=1
MNSYNITLSFLCSSVIALSALFRLCGKLETCRKPKYSAWCQWSSTKNVVEFTYVSIVHHNFGVLKIGWFMSSFDDCHIRWIGDGGRLHVMPYEQQQIVSLLFGMVSNGRRRAVTYTLAHTLRYMSVICATHLPANGTIDKCHIFSLSLSKAKFFLAHCIRTVWLCRRRPKAWEEERLAPKWAISRRASGNCITPLFCCHQFFLRDFLVAAKRVLARSRPLESHEFGVRIP